MRPVVVYVRLSVGAFLATVLICVGLRPNGLAGSHGLSLYGNFAVTVVPYTIGLLAAAYFLLRARHEMRDMAVSRGLKVGLEVVAIALLGVVVTPSFSTVLAVQDLHVLFGIAIFLVQIVLSVRYLLAIHQGIIEWLLVGLQAVATIVAALSFRTIAVLKIMLPAQVLAIVAFNALLLRTLKIYT